MKYLIVGLGNIGEEYWGTRHNIGFRVVNALAAAHDAQFKESRYGATCEFRVKNQVLLVLKPSTYMNLSGNAVRYWMQQEEITLDHVLIVCDDIALPFGTLRMRTKGSDGGHNGLKDIIAKCGGANFARLRFGVGGVGARTFPSRRGREDGRTPGDDHQVHRGVLSGRCRQCNESLQWQVTKLE